MQCSPSNARRGEEYHGPHHHVSRSPISARPARGHTEGPRSKIHSHSCKDQPSSSVHGVPQDVHAKTTGTALYRLRTSAETVSLVGALLADGRPLQVIVVAFGFDERTVAAWWARAGRQGQAVQEHLVEHPRENLG